MVEQGFLRIEERLSGNLEPRIAALEGSSNFRELRGHQTQLERKQDYHVRELKFHQMQLERNQQELTRRVLELEEVHVTTSALYGNIGFSQPNGCERQTRDQTSAQDSDLISVEKQVPLQPGRCVVYIDDDPEHQDSVAKEHDQASTQKEDVILNRLCALERDLSSLIAQYRDCADTHDPEAGASRAWNNSQLPCPPDTATFGADKVAAREEPASRSPELPQSAPFESGAGDWLQREDSHAKSLSPRAGGGLHHENSSARSLSPRAGGGLQHEDSSARSLSSQLPSQKIICPASSGETAADHEYIETAKDRLGLSPKKMKQDKGSVTAMLQKHLECTWVASLIVILIICQGILMGVEATLSMQKQIQRFKEVNDEAIKGEIIFTQIAWFFAIFWTVEIAARLIVYRSDFFIGHEKGWNIFDLFLVVLSLVEVVFPLDTEVSFLRAIRMLRLVKVLRLFHVFDGLRKMIFALIHCMFSLLWLAFLLLVMIYTFSLAFMQGAFDYLASHKPSEWEKGLIFEAKHQTEHRLNVTLRRFKSLPTVMANLFAAITGGVGWDELFQDVGDYSILMKTISLFFVIFFLFGVMNVVTGVFVDQAMQITQADVADKMQAMEEEKIANKEAVLQLFKVGDQDGDEVLSHAELKKLLRNDWVQKWLSAMGLELNDKDAENILAVLDPEQKNQISHRDFFDLIQQLAGQARSFDLTLLIYEFRKHHATVVHSLASLNQKFKTRDAGVRL